jgi:hypothetical protein
MGSAQFGTIVRVTIGVMKLPSPALVVAMIALFVALGGVAGAATTMITTQMIRDNSVTRAKIAINSINSAKIEDGSIQSKDLSGNIRGQKGVAGPKGETGEVGPRGTAGATGDSGETGSPGQAGTNGTNGTSGTNGTNGIDGRTLLNGNGAPSPSTGTNGDYYIDNAAHAIYGPKAAGIWGSATMLVGPTGPSDIVVGSNVFDGNFSGTERLSEITLSQGSWLVVAYGTLGGNVDRNEAMSFSCELRNPGGSVVSDHPARASSTIGIGVWAAPVSLVQPIVIGEPGIFSLVCDFNRNYAGVVYADYPNLYATKTATLTVP